MRKNKNKNNHSREKTIIKIYQEMVNMQTGQLEFSKDTMYQIAKK